MSTSRDTDVVYSRYMNSLYVISEVYDITSLHKSFEYLIKRLDLPYDKFDTSILLFVYYKIYTTCKIILIDKKIY